MTTAPSTMTPMPGGDLRRRDRALAVLLVVAAVLTIAAEPLQARWLAFACKPLATLLVIAYAAGRGQAQPLVRRWVLAGLVLSLVGDIALLWPKEGFLPGLIAFLLAHLAYLVAFTRGHRFGARPLVFLAYALVAGVILAALWPGVPAPLRVPVLVYVVALASMAAQASAVSRAAMLGGALFVTSDALLAINKFAVALPLSGLWILATYWAAQWCIASALPRSR